MLSSTSCHAVLRSVLFMLAMLLLCRDYCHAFQPTRQTWGIHKVVVKQRRDGTMLSAWSLPNPTDFQSFSPIRSTWYDECNPTARRTVYNDPQSEELAFSSVGADWSIPWDEEESSERASTSGLNPQRRRNPLRFLASRLRGRV